MEITFENKLLGTAIGELRRLVGSTQTSVVPSASMLLFSVDPKNGLKITGTDLQTEQVYYFPTITSKTKEAALVSARKFFDICRLFDDNKEISMVLTEDKSEILIGDVCYELLSLPIDEFPEFKKEEGGSSITINSSDLNHLVSKTLFSMPQKDARYYLNGLFLEVKDNHLISITTDGHRLSMAKTPVEKPPGDQKINAILPAKLASYMPDVLSFREGGVEITFYSSQVHFKFSDMEITTKVVDGTYPDYERILPKDLPKRIHINRNEFRRNLNRIKAISTGEESFGANFNFNQETLEIKAENSNKEKVHLKQTIENNKEKLEISFNIHYLADVFSVVDSEEVVCEFKDGQSTAQLRESMSESTLYIVMPLRT